MEIMLFTHLSFDFICFLMISHTVFHPCSFLSYCIVCSNLSTQAIIPSPPLGSPETPPQQRRALEVRGTGQLAVRDLFRAIFYGSGTLDFTIHVQLNILLSTTVHCTQSFSPRQVSFITWPVIFLLIFLIILFSSVILFKQNICQDNNVIVMSENVSNQEVETPCVCGRKSTTDRPRYGVDPVIFKSNCHCTFWQNLWNSCFVSGTHVIPCYTWFVLVSYGFSVFSVSYGWANFRRPAAPAAPPIAITGPAECPYEAGRFGTLASSIQLNNHSDYRFLAVFFFVVHWCFFCSLVNFWKNFLGIPKKMQLGYSNQTHVNM